MIRTHGLTKVFHSFGSKDVVAVDHIDFDVERGDIFGFLGPNGAGKTTTIRMLTAILSPTSGTATVAGYDIIKEPMKVKQNMGFMPETLGFYDEMRAIDLLEFYAKFYKIPRSERRKRAKELLRLVGLSKVAYRRAGAYSHGMRKRLALAQAIINEPELLILDEPTGGLDPQGTQNFREMIHDLHKRGITIFLSSHILPEIQQICNKVCILNKSKVVVVDTIDNLTKTIRSKVEAHIVIEANMLNDEVLEEIRKIDGVLDVELDNGKIDIVTRGDMDISPDINSLLVNKGVRVRTIQTQEPDLEEIFLSLTKGD
jgi:ABC-2 type transport system ATP-binding protein